MLCEFAEYCCTCGSLPSSFHLCYLRISFFAYRYSKYVQRTVQCVQQHSTKSILVLTVAVLSTSPNKFSRLMAPLTKNVTPEQAIKMAQIATKIVAFGRGWRLSAILNIPSGRGGKPANIPARRPRHLQISRVTIQSKHKAMQKPATNKVPRA